MNHFIYSKDDLAGILKSHITTGERWDGYKRTKEVAEFWNKIISGKNHDEILLSLKPNEKSDQKQQKLRIYNSRTKSVTNKIINQIKEVYRSDNIFNEIYFSEKKDDNTAKVKSIQEFLKNFSGKKSVRKWLRERYLRLNIVDPNAFIVTNFVNAGSDIGFYPIEVRSKDVLSRQYLNGVLQYLAFEEKTVEKVVADGKTKTVPAFKYWIFGHDWAILYHKCPVGGTGIGRSVEITPHVESTYNDEAVKYTWYYSEYQIEAQQVPAACVGYIPDPENDDQTFQSILYPAEELYKELIWKKCLYDIHMVLHGIAQKFAFVPACNYDDGIGNKCNKGTLTNGHECEQCHGTGQLPFHTSEQDIITITLPADGKELFDLSKMIHYQVLPIEVIKLTKDDLNEAERAIPLAIFNRSIIDKGDLVKAETATKIRDDYNSTNNVLYDFGLADADFYKGMVTQIAIYSNNWRDDLVIDYSYPNDFNLESVSDLFAQSKEAIGANTPAIVRSKINGKIISKLCIDNKSAIHNYETREYWRPFTDNHSVTLVPEFDKSRILHIYFDQIFRNLEEVMYTNTDTKGITQDEPKELPFSSLPRDKQREFIDSQVDDFLKKYKEAKEQTPVIKVPRPELV